MVILGTLGILSISSGYFFKEIFTGFGSSYFGTGIYVHAYSIYGSYSHSVESELVPLEIKMLPLILTCFTFEYQSKLLECKWFYNELVNSYLALPTLIISRHFFDQYEKRGLELNGPLNFVNFINSNLN